MNTDEITLTRIALLMKKLEEKHPETGNMLKIRMYDDFSGAFEYDVYPAAGGTYVKKLIDFYAKGQDTLQSLMKEYGV